MQNGKLKSTLIQAAALADSEGDFKLRDQLLNTIAEPNMGISEQSIAAMFKSLYTGNVTSIYRNKIGVIKLHRTLDPSKSLKESKDWVEANVTD
jgi:ribosomal protein L7/L12